MDLKEGRPKNWAYSMRIHEETRKELDRIAEKESVSPAFLVRAAVEEFIRNYDKKEKKD